MTVDISKKVHFTLWVLANQGVSFRSASDLFGISTGTGHLIFMEICSAIAELKNEYICWPTLEEHHANANAVQESHRFPGVIGCLDGCHIPIRAPINNPVDFYNRKKFHSVILQAVCNKNLQFINVFIGTPGRVHDARVFRMSPLHDEIMNHLIPPHLHILADSAYGLHTNVLTPYRDNGHLNQLQRRYNTRHSASRSAIERAFGILKAKFRRLHYLDMIMLNKIPTIILACCVLHNLILKCDGMEEDIENNFQEVENHFFDEQNIPQAAIHKRDFIANSL